MRNIKAMQLSVQREREGYQVGANKLYTERVECKQSYLHKIQWLSYTKHKKIVRHKNYLYGMKTITAYT